ncbi:hypothetical protein T484DRAFT_1885544, partial [Baffinella frigidus]
GRRLRRQRDQPELAERRRRGRRGRRARRHDAGLRRGVGVRRVGGATLDAEVRFCPRNEIEPRFLAGRLVGRQRPSRRGWRAHRHAPSFQGQALAPSAAPSEVVEARKRALPLRHVGDAVVVVLVVCPLVEEFLPPLRHVPPRP